LFDNNDAGAPIKPVNAAPPGCTTAPLGEGDGSEVRGGTTGVLGAGLVVESVPGEGLFTVPGGGVSATIVGVLDFGFGGVGGGVDLQEAAPPRTSARRTQRTDLASDGLTGIPRGFLPWLARR
jgi:hypothetical protein